MNKINEIEKELFLSLYNRGGYILDFSTYKFNQFTRISIGVALCEKYQMSKGKSLSEYCSEAEEPKVIKLLIDLFDYYQNSRLITYDEANNPDYFCQYKKLQPIVDRIRPFLNATLSEALLNPIKAVFDSDYINSQIDFMISSEATNPTDCIGKAKELIESCCNTILEKRNISINKNWDLNRLISETTKSLNLSPKDIKDSLPLSNTIKQILQSLRSIAGGISELRNSYGGGHGKSASYKGLEARHARLAIGSSATLVNFLWDSYLVQFGKDK